MPAIPEAEIYSRKYVSSKTPGKLARFLSSSSDLMLTLSRSQLLGLNFFIYKVDILKLYERYPYQSFMIGRDVLPWLLGEDPKINKVDTVIIFMGLRFQEESSLMQVSVQFGGD